MTHHSTTLLHRRAMTLVAIAAAAMCGASPASAQLRSAIDLASRSARPGPEAWQNQFALSPFARFDHPRFSLDGRWTLYGAEGEGLNGVGSASATYFSPTLSGLQLSVAGFANRELLNETVAAVSRFGTDARLSYRTGRSGVWVGRELSRDNKSTPMSAVPRGSAGMWQQWGTAVASISVSTFGGGDRTISTSWEMKYNDMKRSAPPGVRDTLQDSIPVAVIDTTDGRRGWNDAEFSLNWGVGRLAFRGVLGARVLTTRQPNEMWGQLQGTYALASDVALIASGGVHPSSVAYGVSRARFMQLGVRIAPGALLKPRVPLGVRPAAVAFEISDVDRGRRTLRIRVPGARTVELSGDFTGWKPIALRRGDDDRWEATLPIPPGMHRVAIRVDGESWTPPPGVSTVTDEFQGTVGVIVVK